ncbi:hypothetical protein TNCV_2852421 [Trichonephila clavipes]|nr:hypothetical protein TNCV_2852421 [Trichonephila clavipes]
MCTLHGKLVNCREQLGIDPLAPCAIPYAGEISGEFTLIKDNARSHRAKLIDKYHEDEARAKFGDSCPLDEDDLIEFVTFYDNKEVEEEVKLSTTDLIREVLKFAACSEQLFLTHDPDIERTLKFQRILMFHVARYQELLGGSYRCIPVAPKLQEPRQMSFPDENSKSSPQHDVGERVGYQIHSRRPHHLDFRRQAVDVGRGVYLNHQPTNPQLRRACLRPVVPNPRATDRY